MKAARRENAQIALFADPGLDRATQVEFYEHEMGWANRLILGDSLVVDDKPARARAHGRASAARLHRPALRDQLQLQLPGADLEPPPKETDEALITREPEQIQAYRDTWQLGIHSYLTYLRDRLSSRASCWPTADRWSCRSARTTCIVVRMLLDEVFGAENHSRRSP